MQTIGIFRNLLEASFVVSLLQSEGYAAVLLDEGSFSNGYGPMRIQVPEQDAVEAVDLLKTFRAAKPDGSGGTCDSLSVDV